MNMSPGGTAEIFLNPGTCLNGSQYRISKVLGHGGFGITYLAEDTVLKQQVAIKEYFPHGIVQRQPGSSTVQPFSGERYEYYAFGLDRYIEEAQTLARFNRFPGIVSVYTFFRENGTAYMVMEYLEGQTVKDWVKSRGDRVGWEEALLVASHVMDALQEMHRQGVIHRDVSPDNIYICSNGQVKLLDFGAARHSLGEHSKSLSVILKPGYAPFEQYASKGRQGPWTDIYALAATIWRMTSGQTLAESPDRVEDDPVPAMIEHSVQIPGSYKPVLTKALAISGKDRYQDIGAFQTALSGAQMALDGASNHRRQIPSVKGLAATQSMRAESIGGPINEGEKPVFPLVPGSGQAGVVPAQSTLPAKAAATAETGGWAPEHGQSPAERATMPGPVGSSALPRASGKAAPKTGFFLAGIALLMFLVVGAALNFAIYALNGADSNSKAAKDAGNNPKAANSTGQPEKTILDIRNAKAGDIVKFGSYEQDNNTGNGKEDITWKVLAVENGQALLLSEKGLDCKQYNKTRTEVTWEKCSLRSWLNNDFYQAAFSSSEQSRIAVSSLSNQDKAAYGTEGGTDTRDKVFCLSVDEVKLYSNSDADRCIQPSAYAISQGAFTNKNPEYTGNGSWWLRSSGYYRNNAAYVTDNGKVYEDGYYVDSAYFSVRPALRIQGDGSPVSRENAW